MTTPDLKPAFALGEFAIRHRLAIAFVCVALCLGGIFAAFNMPSSVFPQTNFPRVVIMVDNGVMPADEMMATISRPIEESLKDIPGAVRVRSTTGRGSAEISVFFDWKTDMIQSELFVNSRIAQIRSTLPSTVSTTIRRLTFSAFPVMGVSLTSPKRSSTELWETARYEIKPRFLRVPGVARVDIVGGRTPEYHVIVDPLRLQTANLSLPQVVDALTKSSLITPTGMHEENHTLYLAVVDGRVHNIPEIEELIVAGANAHPIRIKDFARVERGPEPVFNVVTADGVPAVLINVRSQTDGSTLDIANDLNKIMDQFKKELPSDMRLIPYYDQSLFVRSSAASVRDAILFGLALSVIIIYLFLKNWGITLTAIIVIPVTILVTLVTMKAAGLSFNLMTLGGIAAAIGLVIDDAIVVVEAIYSKVLSGLSRLEAVRVGIGEIFVPLVGSTLTPVVVLIPLAFLDGVTGVFFRALAMTMIVALLTSLILAVTLTPSLAAWLLRDREKLEHGHASKNIDGGFLLQRVMKVYESALRHSLKHPWVTLCVCLLILAVGAGIYKRLDSDFLPTMDEGGFVIDYIAPPGTSLAETHRQLTIAESILKSNPDVESFSRRTGAAMGFEVVEPNTGDFMVKLKPHSEHSSEEVIAALRAKLNETLPDIDWDFPGILSDLIGDLTSEPQPIEVKLFSKDLEFLKKKAPEIEERIGKIRGVVDTKSGVIYAGPSLSFRPKYAEMQKVGLTASDLSAALNTAMLGQTASSVLEGDRVIEIRVMLDPGQINRMATLADLPLRTPDGGLVKLSQVATLETTLGQLELHREDLRQNMSITARLEKRDLGSAMADIQASLKQDASIPPGSIEFGGLYKQQQDSFRNLLLVLVLALFLVFTVLLMEFRSFYEPIAIVFGAVLAMFGTVMALWITDTSLNVVSFLGAIIGVGIVAKNGILMLDLVDQLRTEGTTLEDALVRSGHRRLRPVLMTSLAAAFGMLPLAYGIGSGTDMLRPMAIAVIGALCISVILSLLATPTVYYLMLRLGEKQ